MRSIRVKRLADETELRADINRAQRAQALLTDETLMGAFNTLRDQYRTAWENTAAGDEKGREKLYLAMKTLPAVVKNLEALLMNGSVAVRQLANLEEDAKRGKR